MTELVIATANPGKLDEWRRLLAPLPFALRSADELGLVAPDETGATYLDNAAIKAIAAARSTGELAIADDTGIEIDALGGAPGVQTARWVAEHGGWDAALLELVTTTGAIVGATVRATLVCAVVVADPQREVARAQARIDGRLRWPPTHAPGPAAIFAPDDGEVMDAGVLVHRRVAFASIEAALRATSAGR